ncbi:hypothetical protein E9531_17315 [Lampropedia puyangensis]|uniref:Uncharacterized protein n=1 Tax=Lampropedia puyangensis TaxID=1330072 RepID=A0A4S8EP81_9BURK|nr:hypothetical protein [Lampropedia puyangensis]THT95304.1 hypothetical protein E9531_17315 [Lampropedia puyangensis]
MPIGKLKNQYTFLRVMAGFIILTILSLSAHAWQSAQLQPLQARLLGPITPGKVGEVVQIPLYLDNAPDWDSATITLEINPDKQVGNFDPSLVSFEHAIQLGPKKEIGRIIFIPIKVLGDGDFNITGRIEAKAAKGSVFKLTNTENIIYYKLRLGIFSINNAVYFDWVSSEASKKYSDEEFAKINKEFSDIYYKQIELQQERFNAMIGEGVNKKKDITSESIQNLINQGGQWREERDRLFKEMRNNFLKNNSPESATVPTSKDLQKKSEIAGTEKTIEVYFSTDSSESKFLPLDGAEIQLKDNVTGEYISGILVAGKFNFIIPRV